MKTFHVHMVVEDLAANIGFYTRLFGQPPVKEKTEYAQWILEDPRINFAISSRGHSRGVNHFGIQADSIQTLEALHGRAESAAADAVVDQGDTTCCYANSRKHWLVDPQGMAWEHFYTHSDSDVYGQDTQVQGDSACCIPLFNSGDADLPANAACCLPNEHTAEAGCCDG